MALVTATDEELAEAAAGGDEVAFGALYERYATPIHDFAARLTRSRDDAADVTQLAFERAWRNLHRRRTDKRFKPWLFTIAHNTAMEVLRRRRPTASVDDEEAGIFAVLSADADVERDAVGAETAGDVWAAAAALSPKEYVVLHHQLREGMEPEEIATVMKMKVGAVYTALSRAKDSLAEAFTALQLARRGRRDCPDLDEIVGGEAPRAVDRTLRRVIRQHIHDCERCEENSRRFVAPAEIFAALVPLGAPAGLLQNLSLDQKHTARRGRRGLRGRRGVVAGVVAAVLAVGAGIGLAAGGGGGLDDDGTKPLDPDHVESTSHEIGVVSENRVVTVRWSKATDRRAEGEESSGVAGYSVSWTREPESVPPRRIGVEAAETSTRSPELEDGTWWFHLSTADEAANWTSTVHLGPFLIGPAAPCRAVNVLVGFWRGRMDVSVEPTAVRPGEEFTVRVAFTDAEGQRTGSGLADAGVEFGITIDGEEVATAPVGSAGFEARVPMSAGEPDCVVVAGTHGIPIVEIGVSRL